MTDKYRVRSVGAFYLVDTNIEESYGFLWRKTREVWRPITIMGHIIFWHYGPAKFHTKKEAKNFALKMKKGDDIEYI